MIKIRRGERELTVTKGAYEESFKHSGWVKQATEAKQKPIKKMNAEELKLKAIELGINLDGVQKVGELRQLIAEALEEGTDETEGEDEEE